MHRHHLGAISITSGIDVDEVASALSALAEELEPGGIPLGLAPAGQVPNWPHLRLHPLTFDRLELVDDEGEPSGSDGKANARAAQLWVGLASAAMASDKPESMDAAAAEPAEVAKALDTTVGVIYNLHYRANQLLRECLQRGVE